METTRDGLTLHLEQVVPAPRSVVFEAFTEPAELAKWWGPSGFTSAIVELDLRVGGDYRIAMQPPEGELFHLSGEFRELDPPARLAYTFNWEEPAPDDRETVVTLSFSERGDSTEVVLDQGEFATEERYELHRNGWSESFVRLGEALSPGDA